MKHVVVSGSFDDLRSPQVRFLDEAARLGQLHVLLWSDEVTRRLLGRSPDFPQAERLYLLRAIRYVDQVTLITGHDDLDVLPRFEEAPPDIWVVAEATHSEGKQAYCLARGIAYHVLRDEDTQGFPGPQAQNFSGNTRAPRKKVLVTGCFDWLHSGHVRFFEETSALGDLYVVVGHDENVRLLKGDGHPLFPQDERRYLAGSIRYVSQALVSSGSGWMDAEPEIARIKPDIYAVNEDGDKPEKRAFCEAHGLEYVVLRRTPAQGLTRRSSTDLRGF